MFRLTKYVSSYRQVALTLNDADLREIGPQLLRSSLDLFEFAKDEL